MRSDEYARERPEETPSRNDSVLALEAHERCLSRKSKMRRLMAERARPGRLNGTSGPAEPARSVRVNVAGVMGGVPRASTGGTT
jgi:hypothetical protein